MAQLLSILNESPSTLEGPQFLHHLTNWRNEDACAIDFLSADGRRHQYNYGSLRRCVQTLAVQLQETWAPSPGLHGRSEDHIIPVLLPQSPGLYISILAILESNAAFCPINLDSPPDRVKFVVDDVCASVIITTRSYARLASWEGGPRVILVDEIPSVPPSNVFVAPLTRIQPHDLAYVMYTSGSTGTPKGVVVSHLAVSQSLLAHERHIPTFNRFLQFAAPSFDVSVFEIFFPLFRGATIVGCSRQRLLNNLTSIINELEVDAAELTPTVVGSLIQSRSNVPRLQLLFTIGEMLTKPVVDAFGGSDERRGILFAMYGPTEAAIHCTICPRMASDAKVGCIGVPLDTVSAFIGSMKEPSAETGEIEVVAKGEVGELVLGGSQLAKCYLNREKQNKAAFLSVRGQRAYRTGDKARMTADGTIEILGRISAGQVKLRGQRVELGEIEEAIYKHPGINAASVSVIGGVLISFVLRTDPKISQADVLETCCSWLPKFMVPGEVVLLCKFPYLPSGKIDKIQLEAGYESRRSNAVQVHRETWTGTEQALGQKIREVLGKDVGLMEPLASSGLDSLAAIRFAAALRPAGLNIPPASILRAETLRSLSLIYEGSQNLQHLNPVQLHKLNPDDALKAICEISQGGCGPGEIEYLMNCTPLQDAMLSESAVDVLAYKNRVELELLGVCNANQALEAVRELARRNPMLRTGFVEYPNPDSTYIQVVWKALSPLQFEVTEDLSLDYWHVQKLSLLRPLQINMLQYKDKMLLQLHIHHALYDGWSLELLLDDLEMILDKKDTPQRPPFRYVVDEHLGIIKSDKVWPSREYWKDHLALLDPHPIPNFHAIVDMEKALEVITVQAPFSATEVESTAKSLCSSPQSLFQAAFALILGSYLGTEDICFGTAFSGRTAAINGIENIVGPCLATLPIRFDISTVHTLADTVKQFNTINRKHLDHASFPLRDIKKICGLDPGRPLFDSLLVWQQTLHNLGYKRRIVTIIASTDYLEFNLTLEITPSLKNIQLKANYQRAIFPKRQVNLLLRQIEQLVSIIIRSPQTTIQDAYKLLDPDLLSVENPSPERLTPHFESLASPVEKLALEDPERPAIDFAERIEEGEAGISQITYSELNKRSNQTAHYLVQLGVKPDDLVCICMEKSLGLYISILATIKAGAGYVPITPDTPAQRFEYMLLEAKVKVLLTHSTLLGDINIPPSVTPVIVDRLDLESLSSENPSVYTDPDNLAYCIYTSGSTGKPKGVLITMGNLLNNLHALRELYPHSRDSRLLQACSQAFDVSVFEIFFAWHIGACLCSAVKDVLFRNIGLAIRTLGITHLSLTPTVAALVNPQTVPSVEFLVTAGEAVTPKVFNGWADRGLYQGYGPSETTNICTVMPNVTRCQAINNIGPPLKNTSVFVLISGEKFSPAPRGGVGEFCFGGYQIGRGYLDASQGVGKFIDHPVHGRLFRSGDFGRLLPDGSLSFSGRKDDQVKIRGQRVELGEIDSALLQSDEVHDCVTIMVKREDASEQRMVTFWIPARVPTTLKFSSLTPVPTSIGKLFSSLVAALPGYMIPSSLIPVSFLPPTTQGKINKTILQEQYRSLTTEYLRQTSNTEKIADVHTWTEFEQKTAMAVAVVTKVALEKFCPETSLFSLGIDSISAISLSKALHQQFEVRIEISEILKNPSVRRLTEKLVKILAGKRTLAGAVNDIDVNDFGIDRDFLRSVIEDFATYGKAVERVTPCTPLQEAMLSAAESSSSDAYNNHTTLELRVSVSYIKHAWEHMVRRHEILRTCFIRTDFPQFAFVQVVLKEYRQDWDAEELRSLTDKQTALRTPYDPPYSITFIKPNESSQLVLSMHHALYDGFALSIIFREMEMLLHGQELQQPISFTPFLRYIVSLDLKKADAFWCSIFRGFCLKPFPELKNIGSLRQTPQWSKITRLQSTRSLEWIERQVKLHACSLLSACQVAWASVLAEYLRDTDICFGNVVTGRTVPIEGINRLVAPCFNTVPARLKDLHKLTFLEAFRVMQSQNAECLPFQLTPLRRIQSRCARDGKQLFDTLLILQAPQRDLDTTVWSIVGDNCVMDLPVVIEITPRPSMDTLEILLHAHCTRISGQDAFNILGSFNQALVRSLQNPRFQVLSPSSIARIPDTTSQLNGHWQEAENRGQYSEAMNSIEIEILEVLANYSDIPSERIHRNTSIYQLGLDSISAVQVASSLRKKGYYLTASEVLQNPSIEQLAMHLEHTRAKPTTETTNFYFEDFDNTHRDSVCSKLEISSDHIEAIRPCTPVQCGMLAQSILSNGEVYVNSFCMELLPSTSLDRIRSAWEMAMAEHDMLRTVFIEVENPKYPFAMVTYFDWCAKLPWIVAPQDTVDAEAKADDARQTAKLLSRRPWNLTVIRDGLTTLVKFTAHHALYDAQSLDLILATTVSTYASKSKQPVANATMATPLVRAIIDAAEHCEENSRHFWENENKLFASRFPDLTPLRIPSTQIQVREADLSLSIPQLEELCRQGGVSVQAAGQVAWARLLSAYLGETSVTFGLTLSGRSILEGSERVAFPTIVTVPTSCDVVGTNAEMLARTLQSNSQLHEHQFTPLSSIQRWAGFPEGNLFDTLFAYQKLPSRKNHDIPWKLVREQASVEYAVSLELEPTDNGDLRVRISFKERLIPVEQADLILMQFDALLRDTLQHPKGSSAPDLLFSRYLLSITPAAQPMLPSPVQLVHQLVEMQALRIPDKAALEFTTSLGHGKPNTRTWTYKQFNQEGDKIAKLLLSQGVNQGELVAICFDKCAEASFAILGVLKAGCAYVALDPNAPADRLRFIIQDSKATLILTTGKVEQMLKEVFSGDLVTQCTKVVDIGRERLFDHFTSETLSIQREISPQGTCYCLYTSGTTGTPKGCEITHENAIQALMAFQILFNGYWTSGSKWLQFASFHFDVSVLEQFWSWSVGICVASAPQDLIFEDMSGIIRALGITHIDLTPSLARLLQPNDVPSLTKGVFIAGGEQLKQEILDAWGDYRCIYNGYGPTEATIGVTMYPRVPKNGKPSNIGQQFQNVGSYVLKPGTNEPVLRGAVGELCVSGKLVGKGYLNRPDLTKERFPFLQQFGERVYRTGDLVRILHDGSFLFLGRADDQVKLRGQRLELSEINEVIKKNVMGLEEVVTLVLKHNKQQKEQLVTFFVLASEENSLNSNSELVGMMRDACVARLPAYMIPTHFIALDRLPLSANNKADPKQLAGIFYELSIEDLQRLHLVHRRSKAWTSKEQEVLGVLAKVLNVEISILISDTNIFKLGVDSISVIGLTRSLQSAGYENASLSTVMKNPSIKSLVRVLVSESPALDSRKSSVITSTQQIAAFAHKNIVSVTDVLDIDSSAIECLAPCTPAQEGMIYRFLDSDKALYFNRFDFSLNMAVDQERLKEAWLRVSRNVQVLRTKFALVSDGCAQVVLRDSELPWSTATILDEELQESLKQSIDISRTDKASALANPYRISILRSETRQIMSLHIFHGLYDGISLPKILRKVWEECSNVRDTGYGPDFHLALPYGPISISEGAEELWRSALKGFRYHPFPRLRDRPDTPTGSTTITASKIITSETIAYLSSLRQTLGVTHLAILQAAWSTVLQDLLSPDVAFGLVVSGRSIDFPNTENIIGPMINTLPFHVNIAQGIAWRDLIHTCHEWNTIALPYQHTPLKEIQKWCGEGKALFDTLFVFQREVGGSSNMEDLWEGLPTNTIADYPLAFEAQLNHNGDLVLSIVGHATSTDRKLASTLLNKVENALMAMRSPEQAVPSTAQLFDHTETLDSRYYSLDGTLDCPLGSGEFEWTEEAEKLRTEIRALSGVVNVNENVSVFELGLDSIDMIKLASRLRNRGISISVSAIVKSQTIAKMMTKLTKEEDTKGALKRTEDYEERLATHLRDTDRLSENAIAVLPATPLQQGMIAEMIASGYTKYFNHEVFRIERGVDMEKLKASWDVVVVNNGIFRTRFVEIEDADLPMSYAQVIYRPSVSNWITFELAEDANLEDEIRERVKEAIELVKDGTLFQLRNIKKGDEIYFMVSICHALYDGWSLQALHDDVRKAYHGEVVTRPNPRHTLGKVVDAEGTEATKFWKAALTGLPRCRFPRRQSPSEDVAKITHRRDRSSDIPLAKIREFCRSMSITLLTLGQTCWALLLASYTRRLDIAFGAVLSCRDTDDANELMFPLMNTVAIRSVIHGSIKDMLRYMQANGNSIRQYQHFPLRRAQALARNDGRGLFDTLFIYQGRSRGSVATGNRLYQSISSVSEVEFPVCIEMEIVDEILVLRTACRESSMTGTEIDMLLQELDNVLKRVIDNPGAPSIVPDTKGISVCGLQSFIAESSQIAPGSLIGKPIADSITESWTASEMVIRAVLSQVSKVAEEQITKDQTIFHLGLDSISAIKVSSILRRKGITISVNDIMKENSIRSMAKFANRISETPLQENGDGDDAILGILERINYEAAIQSAGFELGDIEDVLPVTAGQLYMLARWQASNGALFVGTFKYNLIHSIDKTRLDRAWKALCKKHPILRTVFIPTGESKLHFLQMVLKSTRSNVELFQPVDRQDSCSLTSPLSLTVGEDSGYNTLHLRIHHALYDAVSLPLMIEELQELYLGENNDTPLSNNFREFVCQGVGRQVSAVQRRREFWVSYLHRETLLSVIEQPLPKTNCRIEAFVPGIPIGDVALVCQRLGVSVDALLIASFSKVYSNLVRQNVPTDSDEVMFGLYLANRAVYGKDLSAMVAPTLNLLPLRVMGIRSSCVVDVAQRIQADLQRICGTEVVGTSLAEIHAWTGVRINCFVNILKTTDEDEFKLWRASARGSKRAGERSQLFEDNGIRGRMRRECAVDIVQMRADPQTQTNSGNAHLTQAYLPSVDFEMRVTPSVAIEMATGTGTEMWKGLDVGVFAPLELMRADDVQGAIQQLGEELRGVK